MNEWVMHLSKGAGTLESKAEVPWAASINDCFPMHQNMYI